MSESNSAADVTDDAANNRFVYIEDGLEALIKYRVNNNTLTLLHTEVPEELGGRGIAGRLVQAAVNRASESGETVAPWCPYTRSWLQENTDEAAKITIDWTEPPASH